LFSFPTPNVCFQPQALGRRAVCEGKQVTAQPVGWKALLDAILDLFLLIFYNLYAPRIAPNIAPPGPVIKMPSNGPWFDSGVNNIGPK
jgi:hypothetical protein